MTPVTFDKNGLPVPPKKVSFDSKGLPVPPQKKSEVETFAKDLEIGGNLGISEAQLGLKPAKVQPTIFKEPSVGEDTVLARKLAKQQRAAAEGTEVRLPAAPKVVAEEKAAERALAPKIEKPTETEGQSWLSNTVSALDRGFYKNLIGNPVKGLATVIQYGTEAMTGGRVKEGPVSDALMRFGNWFNNAIDEVAPQDPEFKNSLSDQFAQALGQVGSVVLTGGFGAGGRGAAIAEQAIPKTGKLASIVAATKAGGKELVSEMTSPAAISAGLTMGQAEFERAKQAGASDDQAFEAFYKNAAVGSILEKIPVMQFLKRFNQSTAGGVTNYIKTKGVAGITGGLEEATTEVLQQLYANKTAQDIYNVNQNIFEGLTESGGIGFGVGFLLNAMGARAKVLRNEGKEAEAKVVEDQAKEFESRASKGAPAEPEVPPAAAPVVTEEVKAEEVVTPAVPQTEETLNKYLSTFKRRLAERRKELTEQGIEDIEADEQVKNIKTKISNTQESISKLGEVPPVEEVRVTAAPQVTAAPAQAPVVELFSEAGEKSKAEGKADALADFLLTNSKVGDTITDKNGDGYEVREVSTRKDGTRELVIVPFEIIDGQKDYNPSGTKLISDVNKKGAGDLYEFSYTDNSGNRVTEKYQYNKSGEVVTEAAPEVPATAISQEIADLRAKEQAEYAAMDNPNDEVKRKEIYDRYDKLITPLLKKEKEVPAAPVEELVTIEEKLDIGDTVIGDIYGERVEGKVKNVGIKNGQIVVDIIDENGNERFLYSKNISRIEPSPKKLQNLNAEQNERYLELLNKEEITADEMEELGKLSAIKRGELPKQTELPPAPVTKEEIKTEEYAIPEPSPTGVLQPTQERAGEEGGGRRRMESPVERVAAAQKSKTEAAKKEIERRLTKYAAPTGKQSEVNNLVEELKVFNSQKRGRLGLKKIESLKKRNELILEAKRLGFETKVYKDGSIAVKGARAIDKTFSNYSIDDKFVPLDQRGEKLKNLFNRILGLADAYGYGFDFFIPNVIIGADGKKMSTKQISNAVRDLENGIPSKGASAVLNSLEAMAEKGEVEVRVGQAVETVDVEDYFNRLEKDIADRDMELALMQEAETLPEKDLVKWVEEMAEDQSFETEIYEPDTEEITGEGREEPKVKGEGEEVIPGTAGGVVPPTRRGAPPTAAGKEGERVSGIKKGLVSERILAQVDFEKIGDKELLEKGRQIIESGEVKPKALVDKILEEKSGVLSPAEVVALITYKADLDNNIEDLSEEIARKEAAGEDIGTLGVELKSLEVERDNFDMAAVITAQQQSMSFRLRRFMLDRDFNLIVAINKYKRANNGVIPAEVEEVFKEVDSKIKEVNKKLKEEAAKVYEKEGEEAAKNIVDDVQREQAEKVAKNRIEKARKKRASLLEKYRKGKGGGLTLSTGGLSTEGIEFVGELLATYIQEGIGNAELIIKKIIDNFRDIQGREPSDEVRKDIENIVNDELARPFMAEDGSLIVPDKFIRSLVSKGATTIEQMTDAAFAELESQVPGLTKRQVRDAITKYGKKVNPRIDELTAQINQAKRIGRLISELEDLQKMSPSDFIIKYKKKKPSNTTEAEKVLRKQINVLKKELDIDAETRREERRIEKAIKDAEESLAEYQRRIDELDFSARERGLPETPELKKARQARDEKRKEYESLKRLRPSTRLDASKKAVRKKIEELQKRLRTGNYSKTPKAKKPIDAELYILNAEKEALQERVAREQRKLEKTTVRDVLKEIANIPRTLVSGLFDMGAAFSQGVYRIYSNPILSAKAFTEGAKQFFSEKRHDQWLADLRSSPEFKLLKDDMKIAISDPDGKISEQEGVIIAKYANFLYNTIARAITFGYRPATKLIQSLNPILASQRAFDGYMNYIRVNSALKLAKSLKKDGYTPESNPKVFEQAGDFVNTTTGRASLGEIEKSANWLSTVFFAPRKVAAELKLFTPYAFYYYAIMPAAVRKRALLNFGTFAMSVIASHTLLKAALDATRGDDEEEDREFWDGDSPNFMSFKIGNQRVSFIGGAKTTIVFMSRLLGDRFVDQFGRESKFGERFGKKINTKLDLISRFVLGKLAPTPGVLRDLAEKPNYEDYDEIYQNIIMPIWLQDAKEMQKDNPAEMQALFHLLGFVGANVRTVNPDSMKDKIVFKEKVRGEEVKRNVNLTEEQVIDFQNIYNNELKKKLRLINTEINRAADDKERAKVVDAAREKARNAAQEKLEIKHKTEFRKFPEQEKEKEGKALQRAKEKMN